MARLLFALVAGASPIAIVATFAVLSSRRGRANGIAFGSGVLLGQTAAFLAAYLVGTAATADQACGRGPPSQPGPLLGGGGIKRLTITIVAGATVGLAGLLPVEDLALGLLYVVVAGLLVWLPVGVYVVAGDHAEAWFASAEDWLTANERRITFLSTLLFGFLLTTDALTRLL